MSVFHGKLTATEQPKCGLQTKGQWGAQVCLWLRGQVIHLGGNSNVGPLKGSNKYVFFFFFWWELRNDFYLFSYVFARMTEAPWQTSWMKSRDKHIVFDMHSVAVFRERI